MASLRRSASPSVSTRLRSSRPCGITNDLDRHACWRLVPTGDFGGLVFYWLMSRIFRFVVIGDPKGQPRPRAFAKKIGINTYVARVYDAASAEAWKSAIALSAREAGLD